MKSFSLSYSEALFSLCEEEGKDEAVMQELLKIAEILKENSDYTLLLDSPNIPLEERLSLIDKAFSEAEEYTANFIKILCEKKSMHLFFDCVKQYEKLYNKKNNIEKVTVITAVPLSDALKEKLIVKLEKDLSKKVVLDTKTDKSLLGGLVIRTENSQTDASVKARLDSLYKKITSSQAVL